MSISGIQLTDQLLEFGYGSSDHPDDNRLPVGALSVGGAPRPVCWQSYARREGR